MALNEKIKVEIPKHCVKVPTGKYTYIHLVLRAYRNEKGQPTNERVSIGRLDEESGMLIPNKRYYEIFGEPEKETQPTAVKSIGLHAAFQMAASECGLEKLTRSIFGERADALLTVAEYMLSDGNVMSYMEDWQEEQVGYLKTPLTGQGLSRLFSSITREERMAFFEEWMRMHRTDEYLAYDVTSVSSYSQGIESLEWGYNRDKEALPQINLGMYYGEESRLPLYYRIYPGSIPDKAHLKTMVENGPGKKIRFVMDRGFCTKEILSWLTEQGHRFVMAIPGGLKYAQELVRLHRDEIVNRSSCRLGDDLPYGKAEGVSLFSRDYTAMVLENQRFMFQYHASIVAEHPYSSRWYQWMLNLRPILYYLEYLPDGKRVSIAAFVNPMICWGGLLCVPVLLYISFRRREWTAAFLLVAYLSGLLPWVFITRLTFEYHYFASSLFLVPMLAYVFWLMENNTVHGKTFTACFSTVSAVLYICFFPVLNGLPIDNLLGSKLLGWLPSWPI